MSKPPVKKMQKNIFNLTLFLKVFMNWLQTFTEENYEKKQLLIVLAIVSTLLVMWACSEQENLGVNPKNNLTRKDWVAYHNEGLSELAKFAPCSTNSYSTAYLMLLNSKVVKSSEVSEKQFKGCFNMIGNIVEKLKSGESKYNVFGEIVDKAISMSLITSDLGLKYKKTLEFVIQKSENFNGKNGIIIANEIEAYVNDFIKENPNLDKNIKEHFLILKESSRYWMTEVNLGLPVFGSNWNEKIGNIIGHLCDFVGGLLGYMVDVSCGGSGALGGGLGGFACSAAYEMYR